MYCARYRWRQALVATLVAIVACGPFNPGRAADDDAGYWAIVSATDAISDSAEAPRWHYWFDAQARYSDLGSGANQWLVRPGIGYELRSGVRLWGGYARFRTRNRAGRVSDENRYWQRVDWPARPLWAGQVNLRATLEQRLVSSGDDTGVVLRLLARYVRPLEGSGNRSLIASVEPFLEFRETDWGGRTGLSQYRAFAGVGWRAGDRLGIEVGYMNQYLRVSRGPDQYNHLAVVAFRTRFW